MGTNIKKKLSPGWKRALCICSRGTGNLSILEEVLDMIVVDNLFLKCIGTRLV
jgi:hypothetical protein